MLYDNLPFPIDYEAFVSSLWALTDYTEEIEAKRVVPGAHNAGDGERAHEVGLLIEGVPAGRE